MPSMERDQSEPGRGRPQTDGPTAQWYWLDEPWVTDGVRAAFRRVPYERLALHADGRPVIQTTDPRMMGQMLCGLHVEPGMRVLEIGTGSGYNAALLRGLVGDDGAVVSRMSIDYASRRRLLTDSGH